MREMEREMKDGEIGENHRESGKKELFTINPPSPATNHDSASPFPLRDQKDG